MNLHEYQAKGLLRAAGLPVPPGYLVTRLEDVAEAFVTLAVDRVVLKAQVHAGGRGKAGGVQLVTGEQEARTVLGKWLGSRLVTEQSGAAGQPLEKVWIEPALAIARELYLAVVLDRASRRIAVVVSASGGMDIEAVAAQDRRAIVQQHVDPILGLQPFQCRDLATALALEGDAARCFMAFLPSFVAFFLRHDLSLLEINPLVLTETGELLCLDAKINVDDNALFRQPSLLACRDMGQEDPREAEAQRYELSYIALDGDIGCLVNGAGLAMATMDLIKLSGGAPANFLDVGGGATAERVAKAFSLIVSDSQVRGILVNIFGGIVRCDLIAEGIIQAVAKTAIKLPIVVRLAGTRATEAAAILAASGLNIIVSDGLADAAIKVVAAAREQGQIR